MIDGISDGFFLRPVSAANQDVADFLQCEAGEDVHEEERCKPVLRVLSS